MSSTDKDHSRKERLMNCFIHRGELHGDGQCEEAAGLLHEPAFQRRVRLEAAVLQCRAWRKARRRPAWETIREGLLGLAGSLRLSVAESGRLAVEWGGERLDEILGAAGMDQPAPAYVTLGPADDLQARRCAIAIDPGESRVRFEAVFFTAKDGTIGVEVTLAGGGSFSGELWRGDELLLRQPAANGILVFRRRLEKGRYRIVLGHGKEKHELTIDVT